MPSFYQYVTRPTRKNNILDECYGNIPGAYRSFALPPIGNSDHDTVHLVPAYRPVVQREPVTKKTVRVWSNENMSVLQDCFDCTEWDVFISSCKNVDEAADVVTSYINFCEDVVIPTKSIKLYPNNKPWISKKLKQTLNEKKRLFSKKEDRKEIQKRLNKEISAAKHDYKNKVEKQFYQGSLSDAWKGLKQMTGQNKPLTTDSWSSDEQQSFAESLNDFYCRFERSDVASDLDNTIIDLKGKISEQVENSLTLNEDDVKKAFLKLNARKAAGPDHISGKLLKSCANSLSCIFSILFNWSPNDCFIPTIWKHSIIRPIPKNNKPSCTNDYRPVALTSIVMKCFERIILSNLRPVVEPAVDRFQFAYKTARGTDDATMTLLHKVHSHLDSASLNFVRILFIDFSSAFNTIQPHLLANKLLHFSVKPSLVLWIVRFLVDRTQNVVFQSSMSSLRRTSTGAPQGTVLSPFLFTMYTDDCRGSLTCPLIKFSDDSALIDLSNDDSLYFSQVSKFVQWCKDNYLLLNVKKNKRTCD